MLRTYTMTGLSIIIPCKNEPNILQTIMAVEEYFPGSQIIVSSDRYGNGKGWALRQTLREVTGDVVAIIDGDMDIHPRMIWRLLPFIGDYDIVVGRKEIKGLLSRRILTFLSRLYIYILFGIKVDSQTGCKVFRREALKEWKCDSFAYDIEVLSMAKRSGYRMVEVPVDVDIKKKMKFSSVIKCLVDSFKVKLDSVFQF